MPSFHIPLVRLKEVVHVGSMNLAHKGLQGNSLEGAGLSFSKHPEEWERIARLGGQAWWTADLSGFDILSGHSFIRKNKKALSQWGIEKGFCTPGKAWVVGWEDEEMGPVEMQFGTLKQAQEEQGFDEGHSLREITTLLPTASLLKRLRHKLSGAGKPNPCTMQDLATVWAEDNGLHGVWWKDTFDPDQLSCPRGVIFPAFVKRAKFQTDAPAPSRRRMGR